MCVCVPEHLFECYLSKSISSISRIFVWAGERIRRKQKTDNTHTHTHTQNSHLIFYPFLLPDYAPIFPSFLQYYFLTYLQLSCRSVFICLCWRLSFTPSLFFLYLSFTPNIYIYIVEGSTIVEGDLKGPFSIAYYTKVLGRALLLSPVLLHFTLDPYLLMLSVKQRGIKYHFWVFGMTRPGIEPKSPGPLTNTTPVCE